MIPICFGQCIASAAVARRRGLILKMALVIALPTPVKTEVEMGLGLVSESRH